MSREICGAYYLLCFNSSNAPFLNHFKVWIAVQLLLHAQQLDEPDIVLAAIDGADDPETPLVERPFGSALSRTRNEGTIIELIISYRQFLIYWPLRLTYNASSAAKSSIRPPVSGYRRCRLRPEYCIMSLSIEVLSQRLFNSP